jgi:predicted PurR-regulated permease PerM
MGGTYSGDAGVRRIRASWVHRYRSAVFGQRHVTNDLPESSPEVRPSRVTLKTVFTVCFGVLIVLGLVMAIIHSLVAITLTYVALLLAVTLDHGVKMLVRRGLKRSLSIAVVSILLAGLLTGLAFTLIPPAVSQGQTLVEQAPAYIHSARGSHLFGRLDARFHLADHIEKLEEGFPAMLEGAAKPILAAVGGVLSFVGAAVTVLLLTAFMLIFGGRLIHAAMDEARPESRNLYGDVLDKIYRSIGGYLGGLALICTVNATLTSTFLAINGVPFFLPLGILSGLSSMIPYAGPVVTGTVITLLTLVTGGGWHALACVIYFIAYGLFEGNVLGPLIFRRTVHVNPLVVILSVLFLGEMAGIVGAIIAVPVVAALQIIVREVLRVRRQRLKVQRAEVCAATKSGDV